MRISTTQFFESTNTNYQRNYSNLNKTSEEVSSGIKLNTAGDDPVGAARVLQLAQQNSMLTQYETNIGTINTNVVTTETTLTSIIDTMQAAREQIVSAGSGAFTDSDRLAKASALKQYQSQILGLMNSQDPNGQYIFSGSKASTPPYAQNADGSYSYKGDQTSVNLAVGDGLVMASNTTGFEAFEQSVNTTRTSATRLSPATDDGKIGLSSGLVTSTPTYNASYQAGEPYTLTFLSGTQFKITDASGTDVSSDTSSGGKFSHGSFDAQTFTFRGVEMTLNVNLPAADRVSDATADAALANRSYQLASTPDSVSTARSGRQHLDGDRQQLCCGQYCCGPDRVQQYLPDRRRNSQVHQPDRLRLVCCAIDQQQQASVQRHNDWFDGQRFRGELQYQRYTGCRRPIHRRIRHTPDREHPEYADSGDQSPVDAHRWQPGGLAEYDGGAEHCAGQHEQCHRTGLYGTFQWRCTSAGGNRPRHDQRSAQR